MSAVMIELTGDAVVGIQPDYAPKYALALAAEGKPDRVALGRAGTSKSAKDPAKFLRLMDFMPKGGIPLPEKVDYYTKAAASINRMYRNDVQGCCVISGKAHFFGIATANDTDSPGVFLAKDSEIDAMYRILAAVPGTDSGCYIDRVLEYGRTTGLLFNGERQKFDAWAPFDWTNWEVSKAAILTMGVTIGFAVPQLWTSSSVWDVTNSQIVGGHDVVSCGYKDQAQVVAVTDQGVYLSSWGRVYFMTKRAWVSKQWIDEAYVHPSVHLYNADKMTSLGINSTQLIEAMKKINGGQVPDSPVGPPPPPPPPPPPGPTQFPVYTGDVVLSGKLTLNPVTKTLEIGGLSLSGAPAGFSLQDFLNQVREKLKTVDWSKWVAATRELINLMQAIAAKDNAAIVTSVTKLAHLLGIKILG